MPTNRHIAKAQIDVYAGTLLDALNQNGGIDAVVEGREQLKGIVAAYIGDSDFQTAFANPSQTPEGRKKLMEGVLVDAKARPELSAVLGVMAERDELHAIVRLLDELNSLMAQKLGVHVVEVTTRVPLDDELRETIKKKVGEDLGGKAVLEETVDPKMLGGIVMSADGKRIDASMDTMLNNARNALKQTKDTEVNARD